MSLREAVLGLTAMQIREARRFAVQYVYQVDINQQLMFQETGYRVFCSQFNISVEETPFVRELVKGVMEQKDKLDTYITGHSKNWKIQRIGRVDLAIIRVCIFEMQTRPDLPIDVLIADAAEIGKQFGSAGSSAFINGVLDGVAQELRKSLPNKQLAE